ncbi:hypothetical protein EZS27_001403 [termite gut metagenome]|uniref:Uncharacterized protein n=1 Tax=termite gut metagenome TaxID=433724 RepID=A0A5J4SZ04_9ZZZZ
MFTKDEVIKIFCKVDDFGKEFSAQIKLQKQISLSAASKSRT